MKRKKNIKIIYATISVILLVIWTVIISILENKLEPKYDLLLVLSQLILLIMMYIVDKKI